MKYMSVLEIYCSMTCILILENTEVMFIATSANYKVQKGILENSVTIGMRLLIFSNIQAKSHFCEYSGEIRALFWAKIPAKKFSTNACLDSSTAPRHNADLNFPKRVSKVTEPVAKE